MAYRYDSDLEFLRSMESKDLDVLVETLTGKDKSNSTENLSQQDGYKRHYPDHIKYVDEIAEELQRFGGNTVATYLFRLGEGVLYKEILCDVCDKMKVNYNKNSSVERIEGKLFSKILEKSIDEMDEQVLKDIKDILKDANIDTAKGFSKQAALAAMQSAIRAGGFMSYQITLIVANAVAKAVLGRGLTLAANAGLTRVMSIFAGPIGLVITGLWTAVDIAGPAYRITIPAVIQVAFLRLRYNNTYNVFLTGETGVGKDTIFHILRDGKFINTHNATSKIYKTYFDSCEKTLRVINTAGARDNDEENIDARRELKTNTQYVYVFRADDYLTNEDVKEQVDLDLTSDKKMCEENSYTLKVIGTHKDKCLGSGKSEEEIKTLANELGKKYGKCKILDLTKFNGENKQQELCDFITD